MKPNDLQQAYFVHYIVPHILEHIAPNSVFIMLHFRFPSIHPTPT